MTMYIGEIVVESIRYEVLAVLDDGALQLHRHPIGPPQDCDWPITLVTREGLLRLAQGPFENGFIEDHL